MTELQVDQLREQVRGGVVAPATMGTTRRARVYNAMIDRRPARGRPLLRTPTTSWRPSTSPARTGSTSPCAAAATACPASAPATTASSSTCPACAASRVDAANRTARAEGGATWGDFNDATHAHGLATTGGIISTTGVGGLTLGGGIGYLARGFGLSCDNLISAEVVTADGQTVVASEDENADLFWALRGGGGNFGVVTSFEFRLHPVNDDLRRPDVLRARRRRRPCCASTASSSPTRPSSSAGSRPCRSRRRCRSSRRTATASRSSRSSPAGPGRSTRARRC